jgi:CotH kinase protein/Chitobiase/beta-hexosaminidase C-terminal domain/Lamin Tail Domain
VSFFPSTLVSRSFFLLFLISTFELSAQSGQIIHAPIPTTSIVAKPRFSLLGGFYKSAVTLTITPAEKNQTIYYTTNGAPPNNNSQKFTHPIVLKTTTVVRAIAIQKGQKSKPVGFTYFINEPTTTFPIVSIAASSSAFFDTETGLFMEGNFVDSTFKKNGANFWSNRELVTQTEIYEPNGQLVFNAQTGLRVFGGLSRLFPQKSIALMARSNYGASRIKYPLFGESQLHKFKSIVLRNGGSDWGKSHFRDEMIGEIADGMNLEKQAFQPTHLYINGAYWGIYNIREKMNKYYLAAHHKVDKDSINLIEAENTLHAGSLNDYSQLVNFLKTHNLADSANFAYVSNQIDLENFIHYNIIQAYSSNFDMWHNIKYWRSTEPGSQWRWLLYDTDFGFGLHDSIAYKKNIFPYMTAAQGPVWPNPSWSTLLFRKLLENKDFKEKFVNDFADLLNTNFDPNRVVGIINKFQARYQPEMPREFKRWNLSEKNWEHQIEIMRTFGKNRPIYLRQFIGQFFNAGPQQTLSIQASEGGGALINNNISTHKQFEGIYFQNIPLSIAAIPNPGYTFDHWEGTSNKTRILNISLAGDASLKPIFKKFIDIRYNKIIINEISVNDKKANDWIELYNNSNQPINLKDWSISNLKQKFKLPDITLQPKDYLVICQDSISFSNVFPKTTNIAGNLPFSCPKMSGQFYLYSESETLINHAQYQVEPSDSTYTIQLLTPELNNSDPKNWVISLGRGTPSSANAYYAQAIIQTQQKIWVKYGLFAAALLIFSTLLYIKKNR